MAIPIIDLFAGPGGMGEGFSSLPHDRFRLSVSIEKDAQAHQTLRLRSAFRELSRHDHPKSVWSHWYDIVGATTWHHTFAALANCAEPVIREACAFADQEAWNLEMAENNRDQVIAGIRQRLKSAGYSEKPKHCLVIGGPPCQAYSVVGRSRNKGKAGYKAEDDHRHFLYREYLNVLKEFEPVAFVMENVKGILTSQVDGHSIFESVLADLRNPGMALSGKAGKGYRLIALSAESLLPDHATASDFIIKAEEHGVPQTRHRVIVLGVRNDLELPSAEELVLEHKGPVTVKDAIFDMPPIRSALSLRSKDIEWHEAFKGDLIDMAVEELSSSEDSNHRRIASSMKNYSRNALALAPKETGSERWFTSPAKDSDVTVKREKQVKKLRGWIKDRTGMPFVSNHETRSHRADDLVRYLFVSQFGLQDESPRLRDFPRALLPAHKNINPDDPDAAIFKDRFRVQVANRPATTITSHIAKDGHYFIHYDPKQCRSLTVREAARLQSFPDNYIFLGNRTSQYTQVGNAVPPFLARQIAEVVDNVLRLNGINGV
jgi:DNA (cytosine-5)-methyltransferase 1